jgi:FkbM family methyltransferase
LHPDLPWIFRNRIVHWRRYKYWHGYEPEVLKVLRKIHGDIYVDIGANIGRYAVRLAPHFRTVYAFEPSPNYLPALTKKAKRRANVIVIGKAMGNQDATARFFYKTDPASVSADSLLKEWDFRPASDPENNIHFVNRDWINVDEVRFDSCFREPVTLVKIDVEGAEFEVLAGMEKALSKRLVRNVMVEVHDSARRPEAENFLASQDFSITRVDWAHIFGTLEPTPEQLGK